MLLVAVGVALVVAALAVSGARRSQTGAESEDG